MSIREILNREWATQVEAALALGVSEQSVSRWCTEEGIPPERAVEVEKVTQGRITREELRPDLFGPIEEDAA